jgi:hypothetical protein
MKLLWQVSLCCLLVGGVAMAQRGGGGMHGGVGGGNFGSFRGGFIGSASFHGGLGPFKRVFVGFRLPTGFGFPANAVSLPLTNVSFPIGLGITATPLGISNGQGLPNFSSRFFFNGFPNFNNRQGFNNGSFGNWAGWGLGIDGIGTLPDSSYWPRYDYYSYVPQYPSYQPSPNVALVYPPEVAVQPLSAERAHPVMREYDQNGREIPSLSLSPSLTERGRGVIHDYDQSGREISR